MKHRRFLFAFNFSVGAVLWFLCGIGFALQGRAADAPIVSFALSSERVIAGEPVFLNYTITNPTASRVQAVWIEDVLPKSWLEARLTDETGKDAAAPVRFENQWKNYYGYGKRFKKNAPGTPRAVIFLKPGGISHGRMALTSLVANAPKAGTYQVCIKAQFRWADAKDVETLAAVSSDFRAVEANISQQDHWETNTYNVPPAETITGEKTKALRFTVTSTDPKALIAKAATLRETILTASGKELSEATDTLAAWPEATALEAWLPLAQELAKSEKKPDYAKYAALDTLLERIRRTGSPALFAFLENLTWKSRLRDQHYALEQMYNQGDSVTKQKVFALYTKYGEAIPDKIYGYGNFW